MSARHHLNRLGAVTAVVAVALLSSVAVAGPASAAVTDESGPGAALHGRTGKACVVAARTWTDRAVAKRLVRLEALAAAVDKAASVTPAHRAQLEARYAADRAGLTAVRREVRHDSTCAEATRDARKVVTRFRVYVLLTPQTGLTVRGDHGAAKADAYEALEPGYADAVAELPPGPARSAAEAALAELAADTSAAQGAFDGVADSVLALRPHDYPAQAGVLVSAAVHVGEGHAALLSAAVDRATLDALLS